MYCTQYTQYITHDYYHNTSCSPTLPCIKCVLLNHCIMLSYNEHVYILYLYRVQAGMPTINSSRRSCYGYTTLGQNPAPWISVARFPDRCSFINILTMSLYGLVSFKMTDWNVICSFVCHFTPMMIYYSGEWYQVSNYCIFNVIPNILDIWAVACDRFEVS